MVRIPHANNSGIRSLTPTSRVAGPLTARPNISGIRLTQTGSDGKLQYAGFLLTALRVGLPRKGYPSGVSTLGAPRGGQKPHGNQGNAISSRGLPGSLKGGVV